MNILCIAPHADDETLGCGGTLLRHRTEGDSIHWLLVTEPRPPIFSDDFTARRRREVAAVAELYGFDSVQCLGLSAAGLDRLSEGEVVEAMRTAIRTVAPDVVYINHRGDAHSDHRVSHDCAMAALKPFRTGKAVARILAYETISETDQVAPGREPFQPNVFVDITDTLERKLAIMGHFVGEVQEPPFPREPGAIRAQARVRGATIACTYAEAFMLLREVR